MSFNLSQSNKNSFANSALVHQNPAIVLRIEADFIYRFNTAYLEFTSTEIFWILINSPITIIEISKGKFDSKTNVYKSEENDGCHLIKILVLGLFNETTIEHTDIINESVNSYGMQFFPFISSKLKLNLTSLSLPLKSIILTIPDNFRIIWYRRKVHNPLGQEARIYHSYSQTEACYVFDWIESNIGTYEFDVLLRLGGNSLWQMVEFPGFYFCIALFAIFVSSFHEQFSVLFATIVAVWLFLVTHWSKTPMPQQNTIVTKSYLFLLGSSFVFGIMWKLSWISGSIGTISLLVILNSFRNAVKTFSREAILPPQWENLFYRFNRNRDEKNRKTSGAQESYTLLGVNFSYFGRLKEKKKIDTPEDQE